MQLDPIKGLIKMKDVFLFSSTPFLCVCDISCLVSCVYHMGGQTVGPWD